MAEKARVQATGAWVYDGRVCNILAVSRAFGDWEFKQVGGLSKLLQAGVQREYWDQSWADKNSFTSDPIIVEPAFSATELCDDDELLVVATDGLWDVCPQVRMPTFSICMFFCPYALLVLCAFSSIDVGGRHAFCKK
eukprot:221475-Chlamydomonas_euryale.AAC.10